MRNDLYYYALHPRSIYLVAYLVRLTQQWMIELRRIYIWGEVLGLYISGSVGSAVYERTRNNPYIYISPRSILIF